jgi:hypothetical protein
VQPLYAFQVLTLGWSVVINGEMPTKPQLLGSGILICIIASSIVLAIITHQRVRQKTVVLEGVCNNFWLEWEEWTEIKLLVNFSASLYLQANRVACGVNMLELPCPTALFAMNLY